MERWEEIIRDHRSLFVPSRRTWNNDEINLAYELVASYTKLNIRDTGCGSCRRSTITRAIKIAQEWKPQSDSEV